MLGFYNICLCIVNALRHRRSLSVDRRPKDLPDFFQPPVPYEGCCIVRGLIPGWEHAGVDIACAAGSVDVVAMGDGDLVSKCDGQPIGPDYAICGQGGNYVLIKYVVGDQPLYVYYYHLVQGSVTKAEIGTRLKKAEVVGISGTTGFSTGIHLDVTSETTPPVEPGKYNPDSIVDFRQMLEMDHWPAC